jgi:Cof subfamily protein (haloacid dehalogenase superfamily)
MNTGFKVIALDIDGTLLTNQQKITTLTAQALEYAKQLGIQLILVTGRHHMMANTVHKQLELKTPIICANGAYIYEPKEQKIIEGTSINHNQKIQLVQLIEKYAFDVIVYFTDSIGHQPNNRLIQKAKAYFETDVDELTPRFMEYETLPQLFSIDHILWKIDLIHHDASVIDAFITEITPAHAIKFHRTSHNGLEVMHHQNSKGARLHSWVNRQGFDMSQVIAFGDNQNDISMLTQVGLGVAMGNAVDVVKQCSHRITKSNEEDGIGLLLAEILSFRL